MLFRNKKTEASAEFNPVTFLAEHYGYSVLDVRAPDAESQSSRIYIVTTQETGDAVIKASGWYQGFAKDPKGALETVYKTIDALAERKLSVQRAYRNLKGDFVTEVFGTPWVVLSYIAGRLFDGSAEAFASAGRALAIFHSAGAAYLHEVPSAQREIVEKIPIEKPYEESRDLYQKGGFRELLLAPHIHCGAASVCEVLKDSVSLIDETIKIVDKAFQDAGSLTAGILHNDFNWANGLYREDGSFSGFIDADQLGFGPCVLDIGNTLASFATEFMKDGTQKEFEARAGLFLSEYHKIWPLRVKEYLLILAATERWDIMRILRTMRRHHFEDNRLPDLVPKVSNRFLPRLKDSPQWFSFITPEGLAKILEE